MNWYNVLQSIVTWLLTGFAASCFAWAAKTSKRITILEEHDKVQSASLDKLDDIIKNQEAMSTKLDLLLGGQLNIKSPRRSRKNED